MKKMFTLVLSSLITMAVFADDRPVVTLKTNKHYEIVIDGRSYTSYNGYAITIPNLGKGKHVVKVYEVDNRPLFRKTRKLVSTNVFRLQNRNVNINVDMRGRVQIYESQQWRGPRDRNHRPVRWF